MLTFMARGTGNDRKEWGKESNERVGKNKTVKREEKKRKRRIS